MGFDEDLSEAAATEEELHVIGFYICRRRFVLCRKYEARQGVVGTIHKTETACVFNRVSGKRSPPAFKITIRRYHTSFMAEERKTDCRWLPGVQQYRSYWTTRFITEATFQKRNIYPGDCKFTSISKGGLRDRCGRMQNDG